MLPKNEGLATTRVDADVLTFFRPSAKLQAPLGKRRKCHLSDCVFKVFQPFVIFRSRVNLIENGDEPKFTASASHRIVSTNFMIHSTARKATVMCCMKKKKKAFYRV